MKGHTATDSAALARLLDDDDPAAIRLVEEAFVAKREDGLWLLQKLATETDGLARINAETILLTVKSSLAADRFCRFCDRADDLEEGVFLLAQTRYPTVVVEAYREQLDQIAEALRDEVEPSDPRETIETINDHVFGVLRFRGNTENYYEPENSYMNRVIDRRTGIPITLSALYLLLGRRLGLPLAGIGMPGHFVVGWQKRDGLTGFFIDPFNSGRILKAEDCADFLSRSGFVFSPEMLAPVSTRTILARMCNNLMGIYRQTDEAKFAALYEGYAARLSHP